MKSLLLLSPLLLAACTADDDASVASRAAAVSVDPSCAAGDLVIHKKVGAGVLCVSGVGVLELPAGFAGNVGWLTTGTYAGFLGQYSCPAIYCPSQQLPGGGATVTADANGTTADAVTLYQLKATPAPPDGGVRQFLVSDYTRGPNAPGTVSASRVDFIWEGDTYNRTTPGSWYQANPKMGIGHYFPMNVLGAQYPHCAQDSDCLNGVSCAPVPPGIDPVCADPTLSASQMTQIDLAFWQNTHPDWILYKKDGVTPARPGGWLTPLDFSNPAVLAEMQRQAKPYFTTAGFPYSALSMDVVFLVNYFGAYGVYRGATPPAPGVPAQPGTFTPLFSGETDYEPDCPGAGHCNPTCLNGPYCDSAYTNAVVAWLSRWRDEMHALQTQLVINFAPYGATGGYVPNTDPTLNKVFDIADGVLYEAGFTGGGSFPWYSGMLWTYQAGYLEAMKNGKPFYNKNAFAPDDLGVTAPVPDNEVGWALASNLLSNAQNAPIYIAKNTPDGDPAYNLDYAQLKKSVGAACGPRLDAGDIRTRAFTHGFVLANTGAPDAGSAIVPLPSLPAGAQFTDYAANPVTLSGGCPAGESCVSVPPQTGLVLYSPSSVTLGCECRVDADCSASANGPHCASGHCTCAASSECASSAHGHTCVAGTCGCNTNNDCASGHACDPADHVCDCTIPKCKAGYALCDCSSSSGCDEYQCFPNTLPGRQSCFNFCASF